MRTPEETALLIALLLHRSEQKRARISLQTIRRLSMRSLLRRAFIEMLELQLESLGIVLVEITRGGYGLILSSALDGAPAITAKKYLSDDLADLRNSKLTFDEIREIVEEDGFSDDGDEG